MSRKAASISDYRALAKARLPHFLFEYLDGGSYDEVTLRQNVEDLQSIALRQRVLRDVSSIDLSTELFENRWSMPVGLGPVGLAGFYARRGEVQAARAAAAAPPAAAPVPAPAPAPAVVLQEYRVRRVRRRPAWATPIAAALLLAAGITVGRMSATRTMPGATPDATPGGALAVGTPDAESPVERRVEHRAPSDTRDPTPDTPTPRSSAPPVPRPAPEDVAYRLAAAEHLALTETLLTTVRADARAGRADSSVAAWARDLLGTTRVLLDSPAARDPQLGRLLEDLELVLAQVAQLPAARGAAATTEELRAIDRAVRRRDVLTRVRAAIPAGPLPAGT